MVCRDPLLSRRRSRSGRYALRLAVGRHTGNGHTASSGNSRVGFNPQQITERLNHLIDRIGRDAKHQAALSDPVLCRPDQPGQCSILHAAKFAVVPSGQPYVFPICSHTFLCVQSQISVRHDSNSRTREKAPSGRGFVHPTLSTLYPRLVSRAALAVSAPGRAHWLRHQRWF